MASGGRFAVTSTAQVDADAADVVTRFNGEIPLVEMIARQVARVIGECVPFDDLLSAGREGLLDAARRFDVTREIPFKRFAGIRIRGAILDHVRRMAVIPRRAHYRFLALQAASLLNDAADFDSQHGGAVTHESAEEALDRQFSIAALGSAIAGSAQATGDASNPEEDYQRAELLAFVERELALIKTPVEADVIRLYYLRGLTLEEIATELSLDRSWVSRLHLRAMTRLRKRLSHLK